MKNFTPPSPEAAALGRYGEIPTDMSTGVPQISIPVYEIKSGKLSVPISFSYHASGIKLHDVATPVGLGWVLNAGGEISRNVVSKADESETGLLNLGTNAYNTFRNRSDLMYKRYNEYDYTYLDYLAKGYSDSQSDQYSYSAGGLAGKFMFDVDKTLHFSPVDHQPKITWNLGSDSSFTVIDEEGNTYYFTEKEKTENYSGVGVYNTSWHLTKILSADRVDSIQFYYFSASNSFDSTESHTYTLVVPVINNVETIFCEKQVPDISFTTNTNIYFHERKLLDSIAFTNGYVKFVYVTDREDILPERLSKIKIGNQNGVIKETELIHSYFQSDYPSPGVDSSQTKRLRLDTVKFNDRNSQAISKYAFKYSDKKLPSYHFSPGYLNNEVDLWGYYNASGAMGIWKTTLPAHYENQIYMFLAANYYAVSNTILGEYRDRSSNRYVNPEVMDACILQKITYPTGGYTMFEYEPNQILGTGDTTDYRGGLRVSKIVSFDTANRVPIVKSYVYENAFSISPNIPKDFYYKTNNITGGSNNYCFNQDFHINSNPVGPIGYHNGSPVIYGKVTEYDGFPGLNNGKSVYVYDCESDSSYTDPDFEKYWNFSTDKSWARGSLLNKKVYKFENDSTSSLVKETKNYYSSLGTQNVKVGEVCERMSKFNGSFTSDLSTIMVDTVGNPWPYSLRYVLAYYEYLDVVLPFGSKKLIKTQDIDYLDSSITKTQEIFYEGNNHLYPTKTLTYTSNSADTLVEITKYPQDKTSISSLTTPASDALDGMVTHNILTVPVETETYRNSQLLFRNRTDFKNWNNGNRFYEEYKRNQKGSASMEARIQYKAYDTAGNPTRLSQYYGQDISYIWSYNHAYPAAQVTNASDSSIAYTSFETTDGGNWTIGGITSTATAITGEKVYNLSSSGVAKYNLPTGKKYIVTYWSSSSAATVTWNSSGYSSSGTITGVSKKTKNGWTLYEHLLPDNTAHVLVTGTVTIDELRLYPEDALMTSYTYKPLVGVTSSSSANDMIIYYEYDDFGRLRTIRDFDNNIIKTIEYKYTESQGQGVSGWAATGYSTGQSGSGGGYSNLLLEKQEKDFNSSSATYNQTRWVAYALGNNVPEWDSTGNGRCIVNGNNENIGEEIELIDINPYSSKFGKTKWVPGNTGACPPPPDPCTDPGKKFIDSICVMGVKVYTGAFYDSYTGTWTCIYHWLWPDDSTSGDLEEFRTDGCPEDE